MTHSMELGTCPGAAAVLPSTDDQDKNMNLCGSLLNSKVHPQSLGNEYIEHTGNSNQGEVFIRVL